MLRKAICTLLCLCILTLPSAASEPSYFLTIRREMVAVYETQTGRWYMTDTRAASLPKQDQETLRKGIPLESAGACTAALEDFCS